MRYCHPGQCGAGSGRAIRSTGGLLCKAAFSAARAAAATPTWPSLAGRPAWPTSPRIAQQQLAAAAGPVARCTPRSHSAPLFSLPAAPIAHPRNVRGGQAPDSAGRRAAAPSRRSHHLGLGLQGCQLLEPARGPGSGSSQGALPGAAHAAAIGGRRGRGGGGGALAGGCRGGSDSSRCDSSSDCASP